MIRTRTNPSPLILHSETELLFTWTFLPGTCFLSFLSKWRHWHTNSISLNCNKISFLSRFDQRKIPRFPAASESVGQCSTIWSPPCGSRLCSRGTQDNCIEWPPPWHSQRPGSSSNHPMNVLRKVTLNFCVLSKTVHHSVQADNLWSDLFKSIFQCNLQLTIIGNHVVLCDNVIIFMIDFVLPNGCRDNFAGQLSLTLLFSVQVLQSQQPASKTGLFWRPL